MLSSPKLRQALPLVLLLVFAAALRLYKIDAQSLWYDEGNSARIAERSVALIIAGAAGDIHPPLYYLLLKFWREVFGGNEAALRALSAACGVLTVLLVQRTARLLAGERAAWAAAIFAAAAPMAVYYGQEARMYALLALWAAASSWALFHLLRAPRVGWTAALALATAAGLWTHYAYPFVMVAQGLGVLLRLRQAGRRALVQYVIANVVALAVFAPWAPIAAAQLTSWSVAAHEYVLREALPDALRWIVVGRTLPLGEAAAALVVVGAAAAAGSLLSKARGDERAMLLLQALGPLALLFALNLYRDAYLKFLLVCMAPVFLLAGVSGLLGVFTNRLARIIERARVLQDQARAAPIARGRAVRRELVVQKRRMTLVMRAIQCCTVTVLLVALVVAVVFVSAVARLDLALMVVPLFVAAMVFLMAAVVLFLMEMQLAAEQLRRRF